MRTASRFPRWLFFAQLCILLWGVWGVFAKLAANKTSPEQQQVLFTVGGIPVAALALWRLRGRLEADRRGAAFGVLNGVFTGFGLLAYYAAMARGQASLVSALTGLFPLLTVILAVLVLKERMNRVQMLGVVLALAAIGLLSTGT
jgi:uncharacterized membrane protein